MSASGGHWDSLAELSKLSQSMLVPGVIEEDIKTNNPLSLMSIVGSALTGTSIKWLRESATAEGDVQTLGLGEQLNWSEGMTYDVKESTLKITAIARKLDKFVPAIYGTVNNYEVQMYKEIQKACMRKMGNKILYDDTTYGGTEQMDGMHAWAAEQTGTDLDIDEGEGALALSHLRLQLDAMKYGVDFMLIPMCIGRRFDAAWEESGLVALASGTAGALSTITVGNDQATGRRIMFYQGVPLIRTDYLVAEQANTGVGSDARAVHTSGTAQYSIFMVKKGNVLASEPGFCVGFGNTENVNEFFSMIPYDKLENYLAKGMVMYNYGNCMLGSSKGLGRIYDITDAAITA